MENLWKEMQYLRHLRGLEEVIIIRTMESDHYCWGWGGVGGGWLPVYWRKDQEGLKVINHTFK